MLAQAARVLTIKLPEESENSQSNQIFEGNTDAETRKPEELSVAGETAVADGEGRRANDTPDSHGAVDKLEIRVCETSLKRQTGRGHRRRRYWSARKKQRQAILKSGVRQKELKWCISFLGTADCYIHSIIDREAIGIAKAEGPKVRQLFLE